MKARPALYLGTIGGYPFLVYIARHPLGPIECVHRMANMAAVLPQTALTALDAAVVDCETTGLDSRQARIIQIGVVRIAAGEIVVETPFDRLVDPGIPIPAASSAIHGLTDDDVRGQPSFAALAPELIAFVGDRLIIGHSIAFDLAILRRECGAAGIDWPNSRALDIRLLGRLVAPNLAEHDLDRLCNWLGISIEGRHTALGDAKATAEAFVKLVPLLRQRGIRTVPRPRRRASNFREKARLR